MMSQVFRPTACSSAAQSATSYEYLAPMRCSSTLRSVGVQRRVAISKNAVVPTGGRRAVGRVRAAATEEKPKEKPAPKKPKKEKPKKVEHWRLVLDEIEKGEKLMVAATAPAVRVGLGEEFGLDAGTNLQGEMVTALRELGFNVVFDTRFIADVTIMEEGHELLARLAQFLGAPDDPNAPPMPMFSSCCPGWVQMVETQYPELIPYLSTCKSPQQMFGSVIKDVWSQQIGVDPEKISSVSVMPCLRKQGEADRDVEEFAVNGPGVRDVDHVITTKELAAILKDKGIDLLSLEKGEYDNPMGGGSGAGQLFGTTGGVMEAAIRTCYEVVTQKPMPKLELSDVRGMDGLKEANVELKISPDGPLGPAVESGACAPVVTLKIAVANGLGNAKKVVKAVEAGEADYHFVEVMACPGGCIGGGGQPRAKGKPADTLKLRQQAIYNIESSMKHRTSHGNPFVQQLYRDFIGEPNGEKAHHLLHTHYVPGGPGEVLPPTNAALVGALDMERCRRAMARP